VRNKLAIAFAAGSALVLASVPAAFAWQGPVNEGAPDIDQNSPTGYYIWHNDDGLHLRTHGPGEKHDFVAHLRTDGTFEDVSPVRLEDGDRVDVVDGGHELLIEFHTYDFTDGVDFRVNGGKRLRFNLKLDGRLISTDHIFLGKDRDHPPHNPFALHR
jgi:hypothetical protein